jgi:uncharacterized protein YbbC (DUF1343 family)
VARPPSDTRLETRRPRVATGLARLSHGDAEVVRLVRGLRVGLLAHPASVNDELEPAQRVIARAGGQIAAIFGPEHGFTGQSQDMIGVGSAEVDSVPVYSLYGATFDDLSPRPEWLRDLDVMVIDLQDVGSRYYTFVWSAALMLIACARAGVRCVVLDRPNPLGGEVLEGAPQRPGYRSFVGLYDVPVRHGLTMGEVCRMVRVQETLSPDALHVVEMQGYTRSMLWAETGLHWVLPSPNMPTPETALVYPGGCLIEGTNLSEGRGTTRPFELWGAPFVDGERLARSDFAGARLRALRFEPTFHKHARQTCGGVQVHVTDARRFRSYAAYRRLLAEVAWAHPEFAFRTEPYEYVSDRPAIDLLTGGPEFRECVLARADLAALEADDDRGVEAFAAQRGEFLLYPS